MALKQVFDRDGVVMPVDIFSAEEMRHHSSQVDELMKLGIATNDYRRKSNILFKCVDDIIRTPKLVSTIAELIGPDFTVWDTMFWIKFPGDNRFVSWHQDAYYWNANVDKAVAVWMPLSDITMASGPVRYLKGSHTAGFFQHDDLASAQNIMKRGQTARINTAEYESAFSIMKAGQVSIHSPYIVHGSEPNQDDFVRIACHIQYMSTATTQKLTTHGKEINSTTISGIDRFNHTDQAPIPSTKYEDNLEIWNRSLDIQASHYFALKGGIHD